MSEQEEVSPRIGALRVMARDVGHLLFVGYVMAGIAGVMYLIGLGVELVLVSFGESVTYTSILGMALGRGLIGGFAVALLAMFGLWLGEWYESAKERYEEGECND